jgi:hypothetical protein
MTDIPKVDRSNIELTDGSPVPPDRSHTRNRGDGQQVGYIVLTEEERRKGFVKPVRSSYVHDKCRSITTMGRALSETYARDPYFYSGTFCCNCGAHFDLSEFHWQDGEPMDPLEQEEWNLERNARMEKERREYRERRIKELNAEIAQLQAEARSAEGKTDANR